MRNSVFFTSLMGDPAIPEGQEWTTVSVPSTNLLTPRELFALVVNGNKEEVDEWMSA